MNLGINQAFIPVGILLHLYMCLYLSFYLPERLQVVFEWLGFQIEIQHDCTSKEMLSVLQELGRRDHKQMDCVVCCILSHGQERGVYGVDSDTVKIKQLMEPLNGLNCPTLAGKPKLFFIQACQGTNEQKAVYVETDGPACDFVYSDAITAKDSIPSDADFLLAMATVPSFISFRDKKNGTWFIHSLYQNLLQMVPGLVKPNISCWVIYRSIVKIAVLTTYLLSISVLFL